MSVVIPAYNEERMLGRCLDALAAQTRAVDEIVVVDNNSRDGTADVASAHPRVRLIEEPRQGISFARTRGFEEATGDVIARIDADTIVAPDWCERLVSIFAEREDLDGIAGAAGIAELSPRGRIWFIWYYRLFRFWHERRLGIRPVVYGHNGAFRRSAWERVRGDTEHGDDHVSEDLDVTLALLDAGAQLEYRRDVRVKAHLFRSLKPGKLIQYYRTDTLTLRRHEDLAVRDPASGGSMSGGSTARRSVGRTSR